MTRLSNGLIDRSSPLTFRFNGTPYQGFAGDTLASALLANGVQLVGRSFKYHRPRGIYSAGSEEPNALVTIGQGAETEPNTRATMVELYNGLEAHSQNHVGPLSHDLMALNDFAAPFLSAGFYYKTFMWPKAFWEKLYEPAIRRAAGLGALSGLPDPASYDRGFLHPDLLIIGAGAAGLTAALTAGRAGANVILVDEDSRLGGRLLAEDGEIDGIAAVDWINTALDELRSFPNVRLMSRTTVFGTYDHGVYGAVERVSDHLASVNGQIRQTLWRITAKRTILATGATERHIPFANNDRPGILLSGAMRAYANRWGVSAQRKTHDRIAIFTNNDDGHRTADSLIQKGLPVLAVIDARPDAKSLGHYQTFAGAHVTDTRGRKGLNTIEITRDGQSEWFECGVLGVSGGWNPNLHLASHHRARPTWNNQILSFIPSATPSRMHVAGAARGQGTTAQALADGQHAAIIALADLGITALPAPALVTTEEPSGIAPIWYVPGRKRAWVDFQNDVTVKDIKLSHQENMRAVEHLKRWTTLGMATDQGKTSNVSALAVMAELTSQTIPETGTTIFRPPYTPVSIGVLGGGNTGTDFRPRRLTPTHEWAKSQDAVFVEVGQWTRAQWYPRTGETHWRQSVDREAQAVRRDVGICDVSTLGKIDVKGTDAATFLDRIYSNTMSTLKPGKTRYGLMLREDGQLYDDGTCACMTLGHYIVTTTTANAGSVFQHMEFARQCLWPELDVTLISTTDAWAQIAIAGPKSRQLLARIVDDFDVSNTAFPFMSCAELKICNDLPARLFRISFSGELAYELAIPARYGAALMERLMDQGADLGVTPYGTEALGVLRIEKGHATGNEITGQTTADLLGLGKMVSAKKDSIGAVMSRRTGLVSDKRRLIGLVPVEANDPVIAGSHLFTTNATQNLDNDQGWVTSACYSPHIGSAIGLAYLENGSDRIGEEIIAANPLEDQFIRVRVTSAHFIDPKGDRLRD